MSGDTCAKKENQTQIIDQIFRTDYHYDFMSIFLLYTELTYVTLETDFILWVVLMKIFICTFSSSIHIIHQIRIEIARILLSPN